MNITDIYEIGKICEFLTGITTAGAIATDGNKATDLAEYPNLKANMPIERYSVKHVVTRVQELQTRVSKEAFPATMEAMNELRDGLKEMEEYLEQNPSSTSFLRDPFAEDLVANAQVVRDRFEAELKEK